MTFEEAITAPGRNWQAWGDEVKDGKRGIQDDAARNRDRLPVCRSPRTQELSDALGRQGAPRGSLPRTIGASAARRRTEPERNAASSAGRWASACAASARAAASAMGK